MKHMTLSIKFTLMYVVILVCSIGLNIILYDYVYTKEYEDQILSASSQTLFSIGSAMNSLVSEVSIFSTSVLGNQNLQNMIRENNTQYTLKNVLQLEALLFNLSLSTKNVSSIVLFDINGRTYKYMHTDQVSPFNEGNYRDFTWYKSVKHNRGAASVVIWEHNQYTKGDKYTGMSIVRQLNDMRNLSEMGLVCVDIGENILKTTFRPFIQKYNSKLLMLRPDGTEFIRLNWGESEDYRKLNMHLEPGESVMRTLNGKQYAVSVSLNNMTGLTMVYLSPADKLGDSLYGLKLTTTLITVGSVLILFLCILVITQKMIYPIRELAYNMNQVIEKGTFLPLRIKTQEDEIGLLKKIYNIMIDKIQELIRRSIEEEEQKRHAELSALQAQIKPHFLYNTLDSISSLALSGQTENVYEMTRALSMYYRLSLSKGKAFISFKEELAITENYISILKMRYPDVFTVSYDIQPETSSYIVPKLTLQPFIENAVYHGIRPLGEPGIIQINAWTENKTFYIQIKDNGIGMDDETISYLTSKEKTTSKTSFGAKTTIERLEILYGEKGNVSIESKKGTSITLSIPTGDDIS